MRNSTLILLAVALTITLPARHAETDEISQQCRVADGLVRLDGLAEASGIASSRRNPGVFWVHNDSGEPVLFAVDSRGKLIGRVRVAGATVEDWEDVAVAPCPQGTCVYIADIGDNDGTRKQVTVYRVPEPAAADSTTAPAEAFHAAYPDGPHDAEALFVTSDVYIVTKGHPGDVALYRFPHQLTADRPMPLQRLGNRMAGEEVEQPDRPTAADASPDGRWVAVRTNRWIAFYLAAELTKGHWREVFRTDVTPADEPQGEGLTFADRDTLMLVGEGGGSSGGGTLARLTCHLDRSEADR